MLKEHSGTVQQLLNAFLEATVKYFAKAYTVDAIAKLLSHEVQGSTDALSVPSHVVYTPVEMTITKGSFLLLWTFSQEPALIAIPDEALSQAQAQQVQSVKSAPKETNTLWVKQPYEFREKGDILLQSTDVDTLPMDNASDIVELQSSSPRHLLDKQRVKEAALRAKLAAMKADRAQYEYMEKYGEDVSDTSDMESDDSDSE